MALFIFNQHFDFLLSQSFRIFLNIGDLLEYNATWLIFLKQYIKFCAFLVRVDFFKVPSTWNLPGPVFNSTENKENLVLLVV